MPDNTHLQLKALHAAHLLSGRRIKPVDSKKCQFLGVQVHDTKKYTDGFTKLHVHKITGENRGLVARAVFNVERVCTLLVRVVCK